MALQCVHIFWRIVISYTESRQIFRSLFTWFSILSFFYIGLANCLTEDTSLDPVQPHHATHGQTHGWTSYGWPSYSNVHPSPSPHPSKPAPQLGPPHTHTHTHIGLRGDDILKNLVIIHTITNLLVRTYFCCLQYSISTVQISGSMLTFQSWQLLSKPTHFYNTLFILYHYLAAAPKISSESISHECLRQQEIKWTQHLPNYDFKIVSHFFFDWIHGLFFWGYRNKKSDKFSNE